MAAKKIGRQAATHRGLARRVADARFSAVADTRQQSKVRFSLSGMLGLMTVGLCSGATSLHGIERRSEQLESSFRERLGLPDERIADNTLGAVLRRVAQVDLRLCLHRQVKAELRRGNLEPTRLHRNRKLSVVAIDGKVLSTLHWHVLRQATRSVLAEFEDPRLVDLDWEPDEDDVRAVFTTRFPDVQLVKSKDQPMHGLLRMHRATLVSSKAAVCVHQRPIEGRTNEIGALPAMLTELFDAYSRTALIDLITADAGNSSLGVAGQIIDRGADYFLSIKSPNGEIHREAERVLGKADDTRIVTSSTEERSGQTVAYRVWVHPLPDGHLNWKHARQTVRVERVTVDGAGECRVGNRFFVTSLDSDALDPADILNLVRLHWRCENDGHWTSDAILKEDARKMHMARHPHAMVNACWLRMIAQNIVAVCRALSRQTKTLLPPSWRAILEHFTALIFDTRIDSTRFDAESAACAV